jgi:hypothetical protein
LPTQPARGYSPPTNMKQKLLFTFSLAGCVAVLLLCAAFALDLYSRATTIYPTPQTQSAFFKSYSPKSAIARYEANEGSSTGESYSGDAGNETAHYARELQYWGYVPTDQQPKLFAELHSSIVHELVALKAQVLSDEWDGRSFQVQYSMGQTSGKAMGGPVEDSSVIREGPAVKHLAPRLALHVRIEEQWSRQANTF